MGPLPVYHPPGPPVKKDFARKEVCSPLEDNPEVACTYGLACLGDCQGTWVQMDLIEDVSPSRDNVLHLASCFNRLGLSPLHFRDAVLDSLNG